MAEERTFALVGNFTDNITPKLNAVNSSLTRLTAQMERLRSVTQPLKNDFKELASSSKLFGDGLNKQVSDLRQANAALRDHARELGRVNRAYRAGAGRTLPGANPPGGGGGGGGGGGRGGWGAAVGASVLGNQLANIMTGAIVKGFQMGTNLMRIPFNYFMNSFSERIRDASSDIQSAGGLLAISQRKNLGMFENFQAAVKTQQDINYRLAESARSLPGSTQAYVQQGKRISDSIMTAMGANAPGMQKFAEELGAKQGDKLDALGVLIQNFTEKAVLLGQGTQYRGMYGVPQLVEMLMNAPNVNEHMFQKFAVYRDMPILQSAFRDMQKDLAKTGAYTKERMRLVFQLLDEALPNEVIQAHKNSMAGFLEAFKSAFLDPEVGLFGIGRKMKDVAPKVDQFGKVIEQNGKAVMESLSLYTLIEQTLTGFGLPLSELVSILPEIYEPFAKIIPDLVNLRNVAQRFYYTFNGYTKGFENIAKNLGLGTELGRNMKKTAGARGALNAISNMLTEFGSLSEGRFQEIATKLKDPKFLDFGSIAKELFGALFNSSVMTQIGETIGSMVGGTLSELGSLMGGVTGTTSSGPFATGLKKGWDESGGTAGIATIFRSLFGLILEVMKEAITKAPVETLAVGALLFAPSLMPSLIAAGFGGMAGGRAGGRGGKGGMGALGALAPFFSAPANEAWRRKQARMASRAARPYIQGGQLMGAFGQDALSSAVGYDQNRALIRQKNVFGQMARFGSRVGSRVPGAAIAGGALELGTSLASGESVGKSVAGAVGTVLGGVIGSAFGPVGTMIGVTAGSFIGSAIYDNFSPEGVKQKEAADKQLQAAQNQLRAATSIKLEEKYNTAPLEQQYGDIAEFTKRLQLVGLKGMTGATLLREYKERNVAQEQLRVADAALEEARKATVSRRMSPEDARRALAPLEEKAKTAAAAVDKEQKDLAAAMKSIPTAMRDALVSNILNMPTTQLDAALAARARSVFPTTIDPNAGSRNVVIPPAPAPAGGSNSRNSFPRYAGGLGDAISREMKMKPPGSNLVIANSSETVIPAAGGLGMKDFMHTLDTGFNRVAGTVNASMGRGGYSGSGHVTNHISITQQPGQNPEELAAIVAMRIGEAVAEARSASIFI